MNTFIKITAIILFFTSLLVAQTSSFTYSGPSTVTTDFDASSANATFTFTYNIISGDNINDYKLQIFDNTTNKQSQQITPSSFTLALTPGSHNISFTLIKVLNNQTGQVHQNQQTTVISKVKIKVQNNFSGGTIKVDGLTKPAPYYKETSSGASFSIGAINQSDGTYNRVWNTSGTNNSEWRHNNGSGNEPLNSSQNTSYSVTNWNNDTYVTANLKKEYNATFTTDFGGGEIIIGSTPYSAPKVSTVVEQNGVTATAPGTGIYLENGLYHKWQNWTGSDGTTYPNKTTTFYPSSHVTYTANYDSKPYWNCPIIVTCDVGDPISFSWPEHPCSDVTHYAILRNRAKQGYVQIGTVNRGTTSYTDYDVIKSSASNKQLFQYAVCAYYQPDGNYADTSSNAAVYGIIAPKKGDKDLTDISTTITEYALGNYPNPFNPTTTVNYQLPSAGFVTIKVYDMLGKEVANLVNEMKQSGAYTATFNANNLSSGTYLLNIQVKAVGSSNKDFVDTKKILLLK